MRNNQDVAQSNIFMKHGFSYMWNWQIVSITKNNMWITRIRSKWGDIVWWGSHMCSCPRVHIPIASSPSNMTLGMKSLCQVGVLMERVWSISGQTWTRGRIMSICSTKLAMGRTTPPMASTTTSRSTRATTWIIRRPNPVISGSRLREKSYGWSSGAMDGL